MTKDYRILAEDNGDDGMLYEIYEVYYDEDGNAVHHDELREEGYIRRAEGGA